MTQLIDDSHGLVVVPAEVLGPLGVAVLSIAVDTRATQTMVDLTKLNAIGYDSSLTLDHIQVTTGG